MEKRWLSLTIFYFFLFFLDKCGNIEKNKYTKEDKTMDGSVSIGAVWSLDVLLLIVSAIGAMTYAGYSGG